MKRTARHPLLVVCLSIAFATAVFAQQDFSKVEIKTTKLAGNLYSLEGQGGAIGVLTGPDGVLMVDSQFAPLTERIVAAIKAIDPGPIRYLINTHVHGDHTGGNANLGAMGVTIIARPQLRARLEKPGPTATGTPGTPAPAAALPRLTYDAPMTFHMNGEQVQLIPIPSAHTDGDTLVKFVNADVIMTGDFYRSTGYPNIDRANGGSLPGMVAGLNRIIELAGPSTKILPGHGAIVDKTAVASHRDMIIGIRDAVALMVKKGMTADQVAATKPTSKYDATMGDTGTTGARFVGQLYAELGGK
jgi:glyoxylase-like metal-dependent hydrolase (beta-lactamase superfamily II)